MLCVLWYQNVGSKPGHRKLRRPIAHLSSLVQQALCCSIVVFLCYPRCHLLLLACELMFAVDKADVLGQLRSVLLLASPHHRQVSATLLLVRGNMWCLARAASQASVFR